MTTTPVLEKSQTGNKRYYLTDYAKARDELYILVADLKDGFFEPLVALDTETQPIYGLEGYPRREEDPETGKTKWPSKRELREYFIKVLTENYDIELLHNLGIVLPRKKAVRKGATPELALQGASANAQWQQLRNTLDLVWGDPILESCRNTLGNNLDWKLVKHILDVVEDGRQKVDPVQPGLDPFTTEIFTIQITVREVVSRQLVTLIINCTKVDPKVILPLLQLDNVLFIGANIKFDLKIFLNSVGYAPFNVFCTRIASRILDLGLKRSHSLAATTKRYLGITLDKTVRDTFIGKRQTDLTPDQLEYAATDTEILLPLYDALQKVIKEREQTEVVQTFCLQSRIYADWEYNGYIVDVAAWESIAAEVISKRDTVAAELEQLLLPEGYTELLGSVGTEDTSAEVPSDEDELEDPRQNARIRISQTAVVKQLLSDKVGFPVPSLSKDGRNAAEAEYRSKNEGQTHPFFPAYALWTKFAKQASTYGKLFLWNVHPVTGRIHPNITIAGTDTGRPTSNRPNLLNIPAKKDEGDVDFRSAFLAPEGYLFGDSDYADAEGRIVSDITGDPLKIRMYKEDVDGHTVTAALVFHLKRGDVSEPVVETYEFKYGTTIYTVNRLVVPRNTTDQQYFDYAVSPLVMGFVIKPTRTIAKTILFLFLFGGSAFTLAVRTGFPISQAEEFFSTFTSVFKVLSAGSDQLAKAPFENFIEAKDEYGKVRRYGYATAFCNLRRYTELPENPSRREYAQTMSGQIAFELAGKEYRRRQGAIAREGRNHPAQGSNAVITNEALIKLWLDGAPLKIKPWLNIYDQITVLVPQRTPEVLANNIIREAMLAPSRKYMKYIEFKTDPEPLTKVWTKH